MRNAVDLVAEQRGAGEVIKQSPLGTPSRFVPEAPAAWIINKLYGGPMPIARYGATLPRDHTSKLKDIPPTGRLALEMLAHEDSERIALAGELKLLERQWREADRVAKIADEISYEEKSDE